MHDTAHIHAKLFVENYVNLLGKSSSRLNVAEIGSYDVNGGLKSLFQGVDYVGLDVIEGPGVDVVMQDSLEIPLDSNSVDVVISSSMFEHADFFWVSFLEMVRVCRPGGLIYICAPANGDFHRYPRDSWRFYPDASLALRDWAIRNGSELELLESFVARPAESGWSDFVAIFQKDPGPEKPFLPIWNLTAAVNVWEHGHEDVQAQQSRMPGSLVRFHGSNNLHDLLAAAEIEVESLRLANETLRANVADLVTSKSWLLTSPLRWVYRRLAGKNK